ncbi:unnamed protein product [Rhizoctonia solani]|uniref:Uncharacterized protein n=1 Tax=Rhizoctonia solani TaxID=456999 RepID=A0A8H2WY66_9AGAM|nr:unnamed protein product [Rhizoctonia solani]
MSKRSSDEDRFEEAANAHPSRTTRTSLPPLVLEQDSNQLSSEDRVVRPPSPSPVTDGSGYQHATLKISSIASLAEHDRKTSAAAEGMLNLRTLDHVWEETGREWENKHKVTCPFLQDDDFRKMVQDHRSSNSALEREWQDMWLFQIREWTITKFIAMAHLQKEDVHQRIRSWIETGVYHCESLELWEELLVLCLFA